MTTAGLQSGPASEAKSYTRVKHSGEGPPVALALVFDGHPTEPEHPVTEVAWEDGGARAAAGAGLRRTLPAGHAWGRPSRRCADACRSPTPTSRASSGASAVGAGRSS